MIGAVTTFRFHDDVLRSAHRESVRPRRPCGAVQLQRADSDKPMNAVEKYVHGGCANLSSNKATRASLVNARTDKVAPEMPSIRAVNR